MSTIYADKHALMDRMHRPDPKRSPNMQDKRSIIFTALKAVDAWLTGPQAQAEAPKRLAPVDLFEAEPGSG